MGNGFLFNNFKINECCPNKNSVTDLAKTDQVLTRDISQGEAEKEKESNIKTIKQQLRLIFELIYKEEKKESDIKLDENENDISPEEHSKQFMDSIFNEVTKSLDYDDKIRVKEIKEWINPTRVQRAYAELLQGLTENIDYL